MRIAITEFGDFHRLIDGRAFVHIEADIVEVLWGKDGQAKDFLMTSKETAKFAKNFSSKNKVNGLFDLCFDDITDVDLDNKTAEIVVFCNTKKCRTFLVTLRNIEVK